MPEISRFLGIVIAIYWQDPRPRSGNKRRGVTFAEHNRGTGFKLPKTICQMYNYDPAPPSFDTYDLEGRQILNALLVVPCSFVGPCERFPSHCQTPFTTNLYSCCPAGR